MDALITYLPAEVFGFVLTLGLALLIGIEREEHEPNGIGGVRTFPIIGLGGYLLIAAFPESTIPFSLGLVVTGALVALSHWYFLTKGEPGLTTETATLLTWRCSPKYWRSGAGSRVKSAASIEGATRCFFTIVLSSDEL